MITREEFLKLPLRGEYDVIVVGGGPAGIAAGFAAARSGLKTLIVEQFNSLGGIAGAGGHGALAKLEVSGGTTRIVGGLIWEIVQRLDAEGKADVQPGVAVFFEVEGLKRVLEDMAGECGCSLLYYTQFADVALEGESIAGIVVQNKSGRGAYKAKIYIDASGDGDLAARSGAPFEYGDSEGVCQPMTLMFTIGGVEWDRVCEFRNLQGGRHDKLKAVWKQAQDNGDMRPFQTEIMGWWHTKTRPDQVGINFTHINFVSAIKAEDLTAATIEGRKQAYETISVYRKYIPGMENCYMVSTPAMVGTRESRRIVGHYMLTKEDIKSACTFPDSIGYGSAFIDIHGKHGPGLAGETWYPPPGFKYQLPYRILLPKKVNNLLVAGRCVSVTHEALGSVRFIVQCAVTGEAAGVAAVLAVRHSIHPSEVDTAELQSELTARSCIVKC